jgi:acyl-[acyl-carrier-protein]-phospholipid O-acyltransferase/long-chain-fatty-acid--[acyl-carrier-protein] ligase
MKRHFHYLNISQAIGSMIDNLFKMLTVIYIVSILKHDLTSTLALASALLVIPFLLFSNVAGTLTDRYSKSTLFIIIKWAELFCLLIAFPALWSKSAWPLQSILFLQAAQSAFFGPVKRGIVPELVAEEDLANANGQLTGASYLGIIIGISLPSFAVTVLHASYLTILTGSTLLSIVGLFCAYQIPRTPAANRISTPSLLILPDAIRAMRSLLPHTWLMRAALGGIAFSGIAALFQQILVVYARDVAGLSVEASGYLFLLVAVGIAAGAWLSGRLSAHTIEAGLVPIGTLGLTVVFFALGIVHTLASIFPLLVLGGLSAGLCIVPLTAFLQAKAPASNRGEIFGAVEFWSFGAMVGSSVLFYLFSNVLLLSARTCMLLTGGISAIAAAWALMRLPFHTARFVVTRVIRFIYRIKVYGLENLPHEGGALLVSNHVSYSDGVIIQSMSHRMIHPIVSREIYAAWGWCQPAFRLCGAILVHPNDGPRALVRTINTARATLLKGDLVVIFPEGQLTRNGELQPFKKGFAHIVKNTDIPIIPIHLGNLWGSVFSFYYGEPGIRFPRCLFRRVTVRIGTPLPPTATAEEAQSAVTKLEAMDINASS